MRLLFFISEEAVPKQISNQSPLSESIARKRRTVLLSLFGIFLLFLFSLIFRMQIFEHGIFKDKVLNQITVGSSLPAERGNIYDRNGNLLATNRTV